MNTKSKVRYLLNYSTGKIHYRKEYLQKLNRFQASTIFKARARMLDVKANYKGKHNDLKCRLCKLQEENQNHILFECTKNNISPEERFLIEDLFDDKNINKLKEIARTIDKVLELIDEQEMSIGGITN